MKAPLAYQYFVKANPSQAKVVIGKQPDLNDLKKIILPINAKVNRSIKPVKDRSDTWTLHPKQGDCEDFVVSKRDLLMKKGFGSRYLLIALCTLSSGENHAVLIVRSTIGDYVLDNLHNDLWPRKNVKYKWISVQSETNPNEFI